MHKHWKITMRCSICDTLLTDPESTRKYGDGHELAGQYVDTCNQCLQSILDVEPIIIEDYTYE